jgi:adenosylcobyric acid synthase
MFPYLSNYDDLLPLEREPGVHVHFVGEPSELARADLIILPGTKSTRADLHWLRATGLADAVLQHVAAGRSVLGICGGYQMLGRVIEDLEGVEGPPGSALGLGLLPCTTHFAATKVTRQQLGFAQSSFVSDGRVLPTETRGYEIHMGRVRVEDDASPMFLCGAEREGAVSADGLCVGTLMHGLLDDDALRGALITGLRRRRGLSADYVVRAHRPDEEFRRLAQALRESLDIPALHRIVGL